jgi:hypothetical protein
VPCRVVWPCPEVDLLRSSANVSSSDTPHDPGRASEIRIVADDLRHRRRRRARRSLRWVTPSARAALKARRVFSGASVARGPGVRTGQGGPAKHPSRSSEKLSSVTLPDRIPQDTGWGGGTGGGARAAPRGATPGGSSRGVAGGSRAGGWGAAGECRRGSQPNPAVMLFGSHP